MATVTKIPQTINTVTRLPLNGKVKRRACAYARVSTDSDEQFTSFEAQVDYYKNYIQSKPEWEFVGIYTDEGISGTNTKKREGFNKMIEDALAGKIDLIVTKSVSRFARNTVDSLTTIRKLKDKNVACYFEKENINTLDGGGELLITIMSSFAQEESRSISENVTWGQRKRFSDGKVSLPYKNFLGYKKGVDGKPEIVEEEAKIVRTIYSKFLRGYTACAIAEELTNAGIPSPSRSDTWHKSTIDSILTNEKYKGDALLQKTFTVDFLQKKMKKNEGEVNQYYVTNSHPAIIEPDEWDIVQSEFKRRKELGRTYSAKNEFSSKLVCECCGGIYGQKVWHSNTANRVLIWQCNKKFNKDKEICKTPGLNEGIIKKMFLKAYNKLNANRTSVIEDCELIKETLFDTSSIDEQIEKQNKEVQMIADHVKLLVHTNASTAQNQEEYINKYNELSSRYDEEVLKLNNLQEERMSKLARAKRIDLFIETLKKQKLILEEWDKDIWVLLVEKAVVHTNGSITFEFKCGRTINIEA